MVTSALSTTGGPTPATTPATTAATAVPADPETVALEMQLAAAKERQQKNNKMTLIVICLLAVVSIVIGIVNWAMQGFEHAERMACIDLRKTQPQAECSSSTAGSNGFKPAYVTPPVASSQEQAPAGKQTRAELAPPPVSNDGIKTVNLTYGDDAWERPSASSPVKVCASAPNGKNLYPAEGTTLTGGKPIENGGIFIAKGECAISKLKGGGT